MSRYVNDTLLKESLLATDYILGYRSGERTIRLTLATLADYLLLAGVSLTHGDLTGLDDDDHPQYYNTARGDARYAVQGNNLSDLTSAATARTNLGLGNAATKNVGTSAGTVAAGDDSRFTAPSFASFRLTSSGAVTWEFTVQDDGTLARTQI